MRVALITTTIEVPIVLALYRKLGPEVKFFVAIEQDAKVANFMVGAEHIWVGRGEDYKCSELIGWRTDSRRNIALLEAVKWGADIIVSIDSDMIPMGLDFFERFEIMLSEPYSGLQVSTILHGWVDAGEFTMPKYPQRGLPSMSHDPQVVSFVTDAPVGVMQGIILGVPDTNASTSSHKPFVHSASDILRHGFVVHPESKAVFNSQITAFRRELAPCFAQYYKWQKRNTDILASLVMRRIMYELDLRTYFGPPFAFHARNPAFRESDHANETPGLVILERFAECLDQTILPHGSVVEQTRHLYDALNAVGLVPDEMLRCVEAFLDDMEKVL